MTPRQGKRNSQTGRFVCWALPASLNKPLVAGPTFRLLLNFEKVGQIRVDIPVGKTVSKQRP
jgi:hypothetical protein